MSEPVPELRPPEVENLAGAETGRSSLSHTRLSVFLACHRKFELDYVRRLELIQRPRALSLGAAYQKAIEYQNPEVGVALLNGWNICPKCAGRGEFCETCNATGWVGGQITFANQEAADRHQVDEQIVRHASKLYLKLWPATADERREFEWRVRLRNPWTGAYSNTFDLHGYSDGLVDPSGYPIDAEGGVMSNAPFELIENKLVGRVTNIMVQRLPLDRQLALNRYGIWRATGRPVNVVKYRWMKKPSIKQRGGRKADKSDAESLDAFLDRLATDYEERPEFYAVEEQPAFVTTEDLLRLECELWEWAEDVRAKMRPDRGRPRLFDRNTSHCADYGGCQFLPICTGDPDAMSLYRVRPERDQLEEDRPEAST